VGFSIMLSSKTRLDLQSHLRCAVSKTEPDFYTTYAPLKWADKKWYTTRIRPAAWALAISYIM